MSVCAAGSLFLLQSLSGADDSCRLIIPDGLQLCAVGVELNTSGNLRNQRDGQR